MQTRTSSPGTHRTFIVFIESGENVLRGIAKYPPEPPPPMYPLKGDLRLRVETDISQKAAIANASLVMESPALYAACIAIAENHPDGLTTPDYSMPSNKKAFDRV